MNDSSNDDDGDDADDLRGFIADCEYKTRKILRESNKRLLDNARSVAAKDRVERLKHGDDGGGGGGGVANRSATTIDNKSSGSSAQLETLPPTVKSPQKCSTAPTPVKVVWKGRDNIIHEACETIKSFPPPDKSSSKVIASLEKSKHSSKSHRPIHSSLATSPFNGSNGSTSLKQKRVATAGVEGGNDGDDDDDDVKPAMATLRTIERDLYSMTKKHNSAPSKRHHHLLLPSKKHSNDVEQLVPELKTSVLRKKYRCDERVMVAKKKKAVKLYDKFMRLKLPKDDIQSLSTNDDDDDESSSGTSTSDDDDGDAIHNHTLHDLLEKHVAYENALSRKRYEKSQVKPKVVLSVKEAWSQLEQNGNGKNILHIDGQVQSVPLHIARKRFDLRSNEGATQDDIMDYHSECVVDADEHRVTPYVCPYKKPETTTVHLVVNESFVSGAVHDWTSPLNLSISMTTQRDGAQVWLYEFYEPCNGNITKFALTDAEFNAMNNALQLSFLSNPHQQPITLIDKIVHHQIAPFCGNECTFVLLVSINESGVNVTMYQALGRQTVDDFESICIGANLVIGLHACEVLQLLRLNRFYSTLDVEFWLRDSNAITLWGPLIEKFKDDTVIPSDIATVLAATKKAHKSMLALRSELDRTMTSSGIEEIYNLLQQNSSKFEDLSAVADDVDVAPLSARIVGGCSPYSNTIFPGHASIGKRGVWRMTKSFFDENTDPMIPNWRYPASKDRSQATSYFQYKSLGGKKGNCVTVLNSMALESPVLAPLCYAEDKGFILPPFSDHEELSGDIPYIHLPGESLWETPLVSRYDTLLPPPIVVLDPSATEGDWKDAPTNADGHVYHLREVNEYDNDGFRVKTYADAIEIDSTTSCTAFGISETAASPNRPTLSPILTHKSNETCTESLSRERTAADYHYIAESDGVGTVSEPYLFTTHMSAYNSVFVSRKSVSSFRDNEHFLVASKEAERKKRELAHKMKAAEELVEERMKARVSKIEQNVMAQEALLGMNKHPVAESSPNCVVSSTPTTSIDCMPANEGDEIDQLVNSLLRNKNFLKGLARKLSIPEEQLAQLDLDVQLDASMKSNSNAVEETKHKSETVITTSGHVSATAHSSVAKEKKMFELEPNRKHHVGDDHVSSVQAWNLVPRNEASFGEFSLTKRIIQKGSARPKLKVLEEHNNFISVNVVKELQYQPDPSQFEIMPMPIFVPDLTKERLRLAESYRRQKKGKESMLTVSQQQCLDDILQIPVSTLSYNHKTDAHVHGDGDVGITRNDDSYPSDKAARAILAVKTDKLHELEQVLNADGTSVDTRDQHGNTLLILACQQGNKKLAKVLLRRGADMNARNNGGNSSLHYLYEYKHVSLAEYLLRKGADDGLKNGVGRTCYEGLGVDEDW